MTDQLTFTDRYDVMGPPNDCKGDCEGTSWIPVRESDDNPEYVRRWWRGHAKECSPLGRLRNFLLYFWRDPGYSVQGCDGYHFIRCPDCEEVKGE